MRRAVICFTRVPRPGQTKTRLLPVLSGAQCAALHLAFLRDLSRVYRGLEAHLFVAYAPDPDWEGLKEIFPAAAGFFPQEGAGLGARMHNALGRVLGMGYDACVLTGSDLPALDAGRLEKAFTALAASDVVLGPTSDGGYYLVGLKAPCPAIFQGHRYGGATVLESTLAAAEAAGLSWALAPACDDVDTPEDLGRCVRTVEADSHTGRCLEAFRKEGLAL